jgi:DNA helicase-2/ATP-dependent DNA helicase PcrA
MGKVQAYADMEELSFYDALADQGCRETLGRGASKIKPFVDFIQRVRSQVEFLSITELMDLIIEETGYVRELEAEDTEEARGRIENINEFITKIVSYVEAQEHPTLSGFLEEVALIADIDTVDADNDHVLLMTLHSAKGLEFPYVYLAGMEDGMFPSYMSIGSDDVADLEEERRLCYVGITRAMRDLTLTSAAQRMIRGETQYNRVSRFVHEIPREYIDMGREIREKKMPDIPISNNYQKMREAFRAQIIKPQQFTVQKGGTLSYDEGDTVTHIKVGVGIVKHIVEGGKDYEVTVDFDRVGTKKMFAGFAKLKKI